MKKSIWMALSVFIVMVGMFSLIASILAFPYIPDKEIQILFLVMGIILFLFGFVLAVAIEYAISHYECQYCKKEFKPTLGAYCAGPHTLTRRYLKCPHCGKRHFAKWRLGE